MQQAFASLADQLFELVIHIDPARTSWERLRHDAEERCRRLSEEIERLLSQMRAGVLEASLERKLKASLEAAAIDLRELAEAAKQSSGARRWRELYASLAKSYDQLTRELSSMRELAGVSFRKLSPANYARNVLHIAGGVAGALLYHFVLSQVQAIIVMAGFVLCFTILEILRRRSASMNDALMRFPFFKRIARAREYYQVNSSTYYAYGMLAAVILFPRQAVEAGCIVLAFGDPLASNVGRRFGRVKIFRDKSLVGTLTFVVGAFVAVLGFQLAIYAQPISTSLAIASISAGAGAIAEAFTVKVDDNLTVPFAVSLALSFFL
jgi:dolichol kinase